MTAGNMPLFAAIAVALTGLFALVLGMVNMHRAARMRRAYEGFAFNRETFVAAFRDRVKRARDLARVKHADAPQAQAFADGMYFAGGILGMSTRRLVEISDRTH